MGTGSGLASQGAVQLTSDGRFLLAVDAGSNQISVLRVNNDGSLKLLPGRVVSSGGMLPVSVAVHGKLVYVANASPVAPNYTGFILGPAGRLRPLAGSTVASADMAHATHPNYPERHEPGHLIAINGGPVLKLQPNLRYATDGRTAAAFALACRQAGVGLQRYEHRADLPCGSTIGPLTAARTGIPTVDVGAPQLAMHSAREFMGAADIAAYAAALQAFLSPE